MINSLIYFLNYNIFVYIYYIYTWTLSFSNNNKKYVGQLPEYMSPLAITNIRKNSKIIQLLTQYGAI